MTEYTPLSEEIIRHITDAVAPARVIRDPEKLADLGKDASDIMHLPELCVEITSAGQAAALLELANQYRFPVTPRGLGTGLAGGSVPVHGGVVLSLARMNRILDIEERNMIAIVEPGVLTLDLKETVRARGLFYPPDPASYDTCSIGGNAATNAGGPACVKYGTTREYVLGIEAVLPTGKIITAGVRTRKGVVGYDLLHLLVGSEGTLGIITKLILRLIPYPPAVSTLVAFFPALTTAMDAVSAVMSKGHVPSAIEFLDRHCLQLVGDMLPFAEAREAQAFLLIETDGMPEAVTAEIEAIGHICLDRGALNVIMAPDSLKRTRMWEIRRAVSLRIEESAPVSIPEDIVVPIGRIAEFADSLPAFEGAHGVDVYSFGHAGDGNIHLIINGTAREPVDRCIEALLKKVLAMNGTISGEHGIGRGKRRYLSLELSPESIRLQREIKHIFDPLNILNPGKIF
ncbi:MAG: FAD-binding protein [Deltaproteobacteria bacterium]|nr:FAD-binding protein [Deltaproteobacteria bacterium]